MTTFADIRELEYTLYSFFELRKNSPTSFPALYVDDYLVATVNADRLDEVTTAIHDVQRLFKNLERMAFSALSKKVESRLLTRPTRAYVQALKDFAEAYEVYKQTETFFRMLF